MRFTCQPGHWLELVVSSVSLTLERANTLEYLCGRPHNLSFVALSVMWRPMKAPVAGQDGACVGRPIYEVAAARARLLTAARTGCVIERNTGVCPRRLKRATSGNTRSRVRPARNKCTGAGN
jgi:hypothetical protein